MVASRPIENRLQDEILPHVFDGFSRITSYALLACALFSAAVTAQILVSITTTSPLPSGTVGAPYSQKLQASGGVPPYQWSGNAPAGLSVSADGFVTGTPTAAGTFVFTVTVSDSLASKSSRDFTITIRPPLTITTPSPLPPGEVGTSYSQTLAASGGAPPYRWSGSVPAGLSLAADGEIKGKPSAPGTFTVTATVTDSAALQTSKQFSISIAPALQITSAATLPGATARTPYSQTLSASGGLPPYTWSLISGTLPAGISLNANGTLTGSPGSVGVFRFTLRVADTVSATDSQAFSLTVTSGLTITTAPSLPPAVVGNNYSQTLTSTGGAAPLTWSIAGGALPSGLSLNASSGVISGAPSAAGSFSFTAQVTDSASASASQAFSLTVTSKLTITSAPFLPAAVVGAAYSQTLSAAGGSPPLTWSITTGSLPPGLSITPASGVISGTPTSAGSFTFTAQVADSAAATASQAFSLTVASKLTITTAPTLPPAVVGTSYSQTLSSSGGAPPLSWSIVGSALPPGFSIDPSSGVISGAPNAAGTFNFTVQVKDGNSTTASQAFAVTVVSGLTITSAPALPPAVAGTTYSQTLSAAGGTAPYTWSIVAGALPAGLTLNALTGAVSGVPGAAGTFGFTAQVADSKSVTANQQFTIAVTVATSLSISTGAALPGALAGATYAQTLAAAGGRPPYVWSVTSGSLPPGLTLDPAGGLITGAPTAAGPFAFSVQVTDSAGAVLTAPFSLNVDAPPLPELTLNSVPDVAQAAQQFTLDLNLAGAYPLPISGTLTVRFTPEAAIGADDPAIQFSTGGRSASFLIPPNSTQPTSPVGLQTGTVAGTIQLDVTVQGAAAPNVSRAIRINQTAPTIRNLKVVRNQAGFELQLSGFSTTREVTQASVRFAGAGLQTTEVAVPLTDLARSWYQSAASTPFGSQFALRLPFTVQGSVDAIQSAAVTLSNARGTSQPMSVDFGP